MAELTPAERLQPSLLDRLTDDRPGEIQESRNERVLNMSQIRASVLRDLQWLLNCPNAETWLDLGDYPEVAGSVLNYGVPDFAGITGSSVNVPMMEAELAACVKRFEPRLLPNTLRVKAKLNEDEMSPNTLVFEIKGQIWAQPVAQEFFARTEVDLELGLVNITEDGR